MRPPASTHLSRGSLALSRILPAGLLGAGRRAAWRRTRLRRVASAAMVGAAAWLALSAFLPHPPARGVPVVVVSADLMAGHVLTRSDLAVADWPLDLRPDGAVADPVALVGKALGAGMAHGEPVTAARIRGRGLLAGLGVGLVAAHVQLSDPAMAAMTSPGDHVDLISSSGKVAASDVSVLAVDPGSSDNNSGWRSAGSSEPPGGVVVAVTRDAAIRLATVDHSSLSEVTFSLVMVAPGP